MDDAQKNKELTDRYIMLAQKIQDVLLPYMEEDPRNEWAMRSVVFISLICTTIKSLAKPNSYSVLGDSICKNIKLSIDLMERLEKEKQK